MLLASCSKPCPVCSCHVPLGAYNHGMDTDTIVGISVIVVALTVIVALVLLGRRRIDRISARGFGSAREITRDRSDR